MRTFVIGDIHGCLDELLKLLELAHISEHDMILSVGDIVDRGSKSKEVYEFFRTRANSKVLIGNHERKHLNNVLSYGQEIVKLQFGDEYPEFLRWLSGLDYYYETEDAIIVHAAFEHDVALPQQKKEVLSGSTAGERYLEKKYGEGTYWTDYYKGVKPIIYGHRVTGTKPEFKNNTWAIDTGCCHGDYLTALELPGFIVHQVKAEKDYWREEQKRWQIPVLKSKDWHRMEFETIRKQLEKLAYVEDPAVKKFLNSLLQWITALEHLIPVIKHKLDIFTQDLLKKHPENFNEEASRYFFKTFIFKSKSGNLSIEDLLKTLNTPEKVLTLASSLELEAIPFPDSE